MSATFPLANSTGLAARSARVTAPPPRVASPPLARAPRRDALPPRSGARTRRCTATRRSTLRSASVFSACPRRPSARRHPDPARPPVHPAPFPRRGIAYSPRERIILKPKRAFQEGQALAPTRRVPPCPPPSPVRAPPSPASSSAAFPSPRRPRDGPPASTRSVSRSTSRTSSSWSAVPSRWTSHDEGENAFFDESPAIVVALHGYAAHLPDETRASCTTSSSPPSRTRARPRPVPAADRDAVRRGVPVDVRRDGGASPSRAADAEVHPDNVARRPSTACSW